MTGGWFIGDFEPSLYRTPLVEVGVKFHRQGDHWPRHGQKRAWEYNCLVTGRLQMNGTCFGPGALFAIAPGELLKPTFLSNCTVVVVKMPSDPSDKVLA